jgi:hypothetical protein
VSSGLASQHFAIARNQLLFHVTYDLKCLAGVLPLPDASLDGGFADATTTTETYQDLFRELFVIAS